MPPGILRKSPIYSTTPRPSNVTGGLLLHLGFYHWSYLFFLRIFRCWVSSLETYLCPGLSQHIGTGTCLVLVHAEVALGAFHHMKGLGTRGNLVFQGLPALCPGIGKERMELAHWAHLFLFFLAILYYRLWGLSRAFCVISLNFLRQFPRPAPLALFRRLV